MSVGPVPVEILAAVRRFRPGNRPASARSAQLTNGRLHNHQAVSGSDINGLTHPAQSLRRAQKPRCEPLRESPARLRSGVR
eukprot:7391718-Prymnesium_polylepis.2